MKDIPGYKGYYATEEGSIISFRSGEPRILSEQIHKGYYRVQMRVDSIKGKWIKAQVHQLVLITFKGDKRSIGLMCRHLNGNPLDNRIDNLEWGTAQENHDDSVRHGTAVCLRLGDEHPHSKLNESDVLKIVSLLKQGVKQVEIAKMFRITQRHVSDIKLHQTWKHLWV